MSMTLKMKVEKCDNGYVVLKEDVGTGKAENFVVYTDDAKRKFGSMFVECLNIVGDVNECKELIVELKVEPKD